MDTGLAKIAAQAIEQLRVEKTELENELSHLKEAQTLALKLFKEGAIAAEQLGSTIEKFASESLQDLEITKRAYELTKTAEFNLFSVSTEETNSNTTDAASRFVQNALLSD